MVKKNVSDATAKTRTTPGERRTTARRRTDPDRDTSPRPPSAPETPKDAKNWLVPVAKRASVSNDLSSDEALRRKIRNLEIVLADERGRFEHAIVELRSEIERLTEENSHLSVVCHERGLELDTKQSCIEDLSGRNSELDRSLQLSNQEISTINKRLEELGAESSQLANTIDLIQSSSTWRLLSRARRIFGIRHV